MATTATLSSHAHVHPHAHSHSLGQSASTSSAAAAAAVVAAAAATANAASASAMASITTTANHNSNDPVAGLGFKHRYIPPTDYLPILPSTFFTSLSKSKSGTLAHVFQSAQTQQAIRRDHNFSKGYTVAQRPTFASYHHPGPSAVARYRSALSDRPHSIDELAEIARLALLPDTEFDDDLVLGLEFSEVYLKEAILDHELGDVEMAFVNYARTVTMVSNKIPSHPMFMKLKESHRVRCAARGDKCLAQMDLLKPLIVERYESWRLDNPHYPAYSDSSGAFPPIVTATADLQRILNIMQRRDDEEYEEREESYEVKMRKQRVERLMMQRRKERRSAVSAALGNLSAGLGLGYHGGSGSVSASPSPPKKKEAKASPKKYSPQHVAQVQQQHHQQIQPPTLAPSHVQQTQIQTQAPVQAQQSAQVQVQAQAQTQAQQPIQTQYKASPSHSSYSSTATISGGSGHSRSQSEDYQTQAAQLREREREKEREREREREQRLRDEVARHRIEHEKQEAKRKEEAEIAAARKREEEETAAVAALVEQQRRAADESRRRQEEIAVSKRRAEEEAARRKAEDDRRLEDMRRKNEEEARRRAAAAEEEERRRKKEEEEEERKRREAAEEERKRKELEARLLEDVKRRQQEEADARRRAKEEAVAAEAKRKVEEEAESLRKQERQQEFLRRKAEEIQEAKRREASREQEANIAYREREVQGEVQIPVPPVLNKMPAGGGGFAAHRANHSKSQSQLQPQSQSQPQSLSQSQSSSSSSSRSPSHSSELTQSTKQDGLPVLPLESPTKIVPTDSATHLHPQPKQPTPQLAIVSRSGGSGKHHSATHFPPITTTSPAPRERPGHGYHGYCISYPPLTLHNTMSEHQRQQGYTPSLQSMFSPPLPTPSTGLLFAANHPEGPSSKNIPQSPDRPPAHVRHLWAMQSGEEMPARRPSPTSRIIFTDQLQKDEMEGLLGPELRIVRVPLLVIDRFLTVAAVNTAKRRETCGMLMGRFETRYNGVESKGFVVNTLLIPRQSGTSDSCTMLDEELVSEFATKRGLIALGWIHTHPTQSCFMSSLDLHTHATYQGTLREFFAIVCSPSYHAPNCGVFRLTEVGLSTLKSCRDRAAFHPHPENIPMYTDADKGHVSWVNDQRLEIIDLR